MPAFLGSRVILAASCTLLCFLGGVVPPVQARVAGIRSFGIERWSSDLKGKLSGMEGFCKDPSVCPEAFSIHLPSATSYTLPPGVSAATDRSAGPRNDDPSIDDIVRIGKDIWDVVEENKGVINYKADFTGAVPKDAVDDPFTMTGWVNQDFKGWTWQLVNGYNNTVVEFKWAFKANSQGQYHGKGQYLNHVTTVIGDIYAAWGFNVNVKATASDPYNAGTLGAPVAVQELQVTMEVTTALDSRIANCRVRFFGDGRKPECVECALFC